MKNYNYNCIISTFESVLYDIKNAKFFYGETIDEGNEESWSQIIDNTYGDWGDISPLNIVSSATFPLPSKLKLRWITLVDLKCYDLTAELDTERMEELWEKQEKDHPKHPFKYIVVGIAPYGGVAVWLRSEYHAVLVQQLTANEVDFNDKERPVYSTMKGDETVMSSMFPKGRLETIMKQYTYRYLPLEEYFDGKLWRRYSCTDEHYENIDVEGVEDQRVDGTFNQIDTASLFKYHTTGMPKRITVKWKEDGADFFAHFWLDTHYVNWFFESFQKMFPETPADLLIRLDTRANRYEVAMTAEDLEPRAFIGTQYIVLRDNVEISRSPYFSKKDKEWYWE